MTCVRQLRCVYRPYAELHTCPLCTTNRYCPNPNSRKKKKVPKVPQQQMVTIPLGPQLQALRRSKQGSKAMSYRARMLSSLVEQEDEDGNLPLYEDILSGKDIRKFAAKAGMTEDDITVGLSFDGAQLYRNKQSDTWIAVWIVYDYHPTLRYKRKHILPASCSRP
ncbi:hypothetical protein FA13DRAFT_1842731 [Coprinellus micaceus]|uniref:Uncharacterized protein n=1 Tax=Coprinellus micaceus TaxID=71717 RepID=A0A4Y7SEG2_COPMI|nr:hypothetical protein FA13DRAFT_1842731 [Coprinellus micaceus]